MKKTIAVAGVPNCGKTTFWNKITGLHGKTGNWPGVTAEKLSAQLKSDPDIDIVDLPGTYSLSGISLEEKSACEYLKNTPPDAVIIIIDGTKPEQGIYLASEIISFGLPCVVGINFCDELFRNGTKINVPLLCKELAAPVFLISAKNGTGINKIIDAAKNAESKKVPELSSFQRRKKAEFLAEKCFSSDDNSGSHRFAAFFGFLFLIVLMLAFFRGVFMLKDYISLFFEHCTAILSAVLIHIGVSYPLVSLASEGFLGGIANIFTFLPELIVVFLFLSLLEESGYMARAAFYLDHLLKIFGLSGRSVISLILGLGCTVSAVYSSKSSDSYDAQNRTLSALMFVPCSARLPLLLLFCEYMFPKSALFILIGIYSFTVFCGGIFLFLTKNKEPSNFILEIPPLRFPDIMSTLKNIFRRTSSFFLKASSAVVFTSVLIWFLKNFSLSMEPVYLQSESALYSVSSFVSPFFSPTGIPFEGIAAFFSGMFAKECAVFTLLSFGSDPSLIFSPVSAISFLLFYYIYAPCLPCLSVIAKDFGIKKAVWLFFRQTALAYIISFAFYQFALLFQNFFIL